jgi:hypothetical protein
LPTTFVALLDRADPADVETHRGIEFERMTAGGGLGRAIHHADLHADLIDEDHHGVGAVDRGGQLAQRLAHQPRPAGRAGCRPFRLRARRAEPMPPTESITSTSTGARAHQRVGDLERLLAGIGLGDQQVVDVDAELARIDRIERVLGVDEGADAALLLRFGEAVQRQRGLARGFRPVDLDHPAARQAADAERDVEPERAGRTVSTSIDLSFLPSRMIEPLPKLRSIWESAASQGLRFIHGGTFNNT